ncbi:MAG TPA: ribonuclease domain-containing protein [Niabella sp.]|mgnify:CR=1 FL=1|nr:ribonuclease domain-containing protein [Niabella sp.]HOZ97743.1 ribonuclease domain-containing protein [Niabella sp.]HQW14058.1 ribonuclease domain-containing protein [Niabella sp.]HQX19399.1 ribonuclease domain-containing protein [Niabella sp.]HQX40248.1 ribonuclease domain-containing protein [Niabella sp.]
MKKTSNLLIVLLLVLLAGLMVYCKNQKATTSVSTTDISVLTKESVVIPFVKQHQRLPDYYITKKEAREKGWNASDGNLCEALPGRAIGGDVFGNREGNLPNASGRKWFEADLNYHCGRRNADRLLFSNDGLIYVTNDHYKTFQQK